MDIIIHKGFLIEIFELEGNNHKEGTYTVFSETGLIFVANVNKLTKIYGGSKEEVAYAAKQSIDKYLDSNN
jgi:hypothetical protein